MTLESIFQKLDSKNYKILQDAINEMDPLENTSALYLYLWKYYGVYIFFQINKDCIYFICKLDTNITINNVVLTDYYAIKPIVKDKNNFKAIFKDFVKIFKELTSLTTFYIDRLISMDLDLLVKANIMNSSEIAYLYELEQLKYFPGKKMQKKRNLLNFFNKNFIDKLVIKKYNFELATEVLFFCKQHIQRYSHNFREYEYQGIKELIEIANYEKNINGIVIYYDSRIIGVTLGYSHNQYYEIFLEKADRDFKGSYQFLISNNLILNKVSNPYIDRQDSDSISGLIESKRSYKPFKIVYGNLVEINANDY